MPASYLKNKQPSQAPAERAPSAWPCGRTCLILDPDLRLPCLPVCRSSHKQVQLNLRHTTSRRYLPVESIPQSSIVRHDADLRRRYSQDQTIHRDLADGRCCLILCPSQLAAAVCFVNRRHMANLTCSQARTTASLLVKAVVYNVRMARRHVPTVMMERSARFQYPSIAPNVHRPTAPSPLLPPHHQVRQVPVQKPAVEPSLVP